MKKQFKALSTKAKKFVAKNETEIKVLTGYFIGAAVAFATTAYYEKKSWSDAEALNVDRPENSFLVKKQDGEIGYVTPPED